MEWGLTVVPWKPKSWSSWRTFLSMGAWWMGMGMMGTVLGRGAAEGEHAAVEVFEVGGGELVVVGGDELDADVFEGEGGVGVVGE